MKHRACKLRRARRRLMVREDGGVMIEFALVSPILILLLMGIIEFGAALFIHNNMVNVARDASRRTATGEFTPSQAETFAQNALVNWGMNYSVDVTLPNPADPMDLDVTTVITVPLSDAAILDYAGLLEGLTLTARVIMRDEE